MTPIVAVQWFESERGWGIRPDGWSIHKTTADAEDFINDYKAKYHTAPTAPDTYSFPDAQKVIDSSAVPQEYLDQLEEAPHGTWVPQRHIQ
jgi:hypothetical protein